MKKSFSVVGTILVVLSLSGIAGALEYTFQPNYNNQGGDNNLFDLNDLDHSKVYTWGINWNLPANQTIVGASLSFDNIKNWKKPTRSDPNDLWVDLLNSATNGVTVESDNEPGQVNYFSESEKEGKNTLLKKWHNLSNKPQDITYNFKKIQVEKLTSYLNDGTFGLGFDPDCHFYNDGITLTIQTTTVVPEPATLLLFGGGLLGLAGIVRKRLNK